MIIFCIVLDFVIIIVFVLEMQEIGNVMLNEKLKGNYFFFGINIVYFVLQMFDIVKVGVN